MKSSIDEIRKRHKRFESKADGVYVWDATKAAIDAHQDRKCLLEKLDDAYFVQASMEKENKSLRKQVTELEKELKQAHEYMNRIQR